MIKKIIVLLVIVACSLMLVTCGSKTVENEKSQEPHRDPIDEYELQNPPEQQK